MKTNKILFSISTILILGAVILLIFSFGVPKPSGVRLTSSKLEKVKQPEGEQYETLYNNLYKILPGKIRKEAMGVHASNIYTEEGLSKSDELTQSVVGESATINLSSVNSTTIDITGDIIGIPKGEVWIDIQVTIEKTNENFNKGDTIFTKLVCGYPGAKVPVPKLYIINDYGKTVIRCNTKKETLPVIYALFLGKSHAPLSNIFINTGSTQLVIIGGDGFDYFVGGTSNDLFFGGCGDDFIRGGLGDDVICGNEGEDVLIGDGYADILLGGKGKDGYYRDDILIGGPNIPNQYTKDILYDPDPGAIIIQ